MANTGMMISIGIMPPLYLMVLLSVSVPVDADCCRTHKLDQNDNTICADGSDGTPCCGVGSCNIFCCNCDDGCRQQPPEWDDFQDGAGNVRWQWNCDFPGNDLAAHETLGEECGQKCINTPPCNAFSHFHGKCYLKLIHRVDRKPAEGGICGFLPWGINKSK